ncbi:MAG: hypothetical protein AAB091_02020, partial [Elusimicrobiota bacterium]
NGFSTNTAISITGNSSDLGVLSIAATVFVSIDKSGGGDNCYNPFASPAQFSAVCPNYFPAGGETGNWSVTGINWNHGSGGNAIYYISARASDTANNVQSVFNLGVSSLSFSYDTAAPVSYINSVATATYYRQLAQITGTFSDTSGLSNITFMEMQLRDFGIDNQEGGAQDQYWKDWDGIGFNSTVSTWVAVSFVGGSSGTWSYNISGWTNGRRYRVSARAKDAAENQEAYAPGPIFTIDMSTPLAAITQPTNNSGWVYFPALQGTANDGSGDLVVSSQSGIVYSTHVQTAIQRQDNGKCWNDGAWIDSPCHPRWIDAPFVGYSSGVWTYGNVPSGINLDSGVRYLVLARARDTARPYLPGNLQDSFDVGTSSNIFYVDIDSASAAITFPYDLTQRNSLVITSGTIADTFSGVLNAVLRISTGTSYWNGAGWLAPAVSTEVFAQAASTGSFSSTWSYVNLPSNWGASGAVVKIDVRGRDVTANTQNTALSVQWLYDNQAP